MKITPQTTTQLPLRAFAGCSLGPFGKRTDHGATLSTNQTVQFAVTLDRSLVANFVPGPPKLELPAVAANAITLRWPTNNAAGFTVP